MLMCKVVIHIFFQPKDVAKCFRNITMFHDKLECYKRKSMKNHTLNNLRNIEKYSLKKRTKIG